MPESVLNPSFSIELDLKVVAKGNHYKISRWGRRTGIRDTDEARTFKNSAAMLVLVKMAGAPSPFKKTDKLKITCVIRQATYRPDLNMQSLYDALQRAGVIHNDRQIREEHNWIEDAKGPPRIRLKLERVGKLPWNPR